VSQHDQTTEQWVRQFCEAKGLMEGSHHGQTDYRLAGKIVVNLESDDAITIKIPVDEQQALLHEHPDAVRLPPGGGTTAGPRCNSTCCPASWSDN
jgi:hypothetical protein